jgi:hypothetical protein
LTTTVVGWYLDDRIPFLAIAALPNPLAKDSSTSLALVLCFLFNRVQYSERLDSSVGNKRRSPAVGSSWPMPRFTFP